MFAAEQAGATYFVKPLLTTNQNEQVSDYFDIKLRPEEKQTLQVEIHNNTGETKSFTAVTENAITNDHGVIEYQHTTDKYDETLTHKFTDLGKLQQTTIEVEPGKPAVVDIQLQMPNEEFDGLVLGGIRISEKKAENADDKSTISNVFSYVIPVKIRENDNLIPNKLNFKGVSIGQQTYENVIRSRLQNPQPEILRELTLKAQIFKKDGKEPVYEDTKENLKMAPNSAFSYSVSLGTQEFKAGEYRLELTAKAADLDEKWTEAFTITGEEAKQMNDTMVFKKQTNWTLYLLIGALILAVIIVIYLLQRQKKLKQAALKAAELKKMKKRKRMKKTVKRSLLFLLIASGIASSVEAHAEATDDSGLSEATITIKSKTIESSSTSTTKPVGSGKETGKKLPQTGEDSTVSAIYTGSILLLSAAAILILKKERGLTHEN